MTLNLTVTTPRCIYQSADYRLVDWTSGRTRDFEIQKIVLKTAFSWHATICFAGVGQTSGLNVGDWLAERLNSISADEPFESLLEALLKADEWLANVPSPYNRHSFSVGAFVESQPVFALVSNFEQLEGPPLRVASLKLSVFKVRPTQPKTFVSGQSEAVGRAERRKLAVLALSDPDSQVMYEELIKVNRGVARRRSALVSRACFTTHVRLTGESGSYAYNPENRPHVPGFMVPPEFQETITQLLDKEYGRGRYRFVASSGIRSTASEEYHATQLREKPNDANAHCNYGVFLQNQQKDPEGAEREYRKAIELDGDHANAIGNLANILWEKGDIEGAAALYSRALDLDPGENLTWNYARFLEALSTDRGVACQVLDRGITAHPDSGRLLLLRGQLTLVDAPSDAVEWFKKARDKGADQADVEAGYACALQLVGAPIGECIAAYLVAIVLAPENGSIRLNLAQLMFVKGDDQEAGKHLNEALRLGLDNPAQLEAQFYLLCHTAFDPEAVFQKTKALLSADASLTWNVKPNIEVVRKLDPKKASALEMVREVMAGEQDPTALDDLLAAWVSRC